jgi:hypothetical protein
VKIEDGPRFRQGNRNPYLVYDETQPHEATGRPGRLVAVCLSVEDAQRVTRAMNDAYGGRVDNSSTGSA